MLSFDDIIGQDAIKAHLRGAVEAGQTSHAFIFSGEDGSGKLMLAKRFAAALLCDGSGAKPCGMCFSCMQAESGNHPDIIYVTHQKANISVDDIRNQLVNDVSIKPYSGEHKIYIVDEAETMNEAAQNALLKTLEEPPEYAVIILLTTNTGCFLQTILSRCVVLQFRPLDNRLITDYLMKHLQLPDYMASLCASFSCGCIGRALKYAGDEQFIALRDSVFKLLREVGNMRQSELMSAVEGLSSSDNKPATSDLFDLFTLWFRDVLVFKSTGDTDRIICSTDIDSIRAQAEAMSFAHLNKIMNTIERTKQRLKANISLSTALELLMLTIKEDL